MLRLLYIFLIIFTLTNCCQYNNDSVLFSDSYNELLNLYNAGDTIVFISNNNHINSIIISSIDSLKECGGFLGYPRKNKLVNIKHLPLNLWNDGTEHIQNRPPRLLNQELISIENDLSGKIKESIIGFEFQDFNAYLKQMPDKTSDTLLTYLKIKEYWRLVTDLPKDNQTDTSIIEIIWTTQFGLTAYYYKNGDYYKIKNVR